MKTQTESPPTTCPECVNGKHVNCTVRVPEPVENRPNEMQWAPCPCECGGGLRAWV